MAKDHVEYFRALSVETRLKIIELLKSRGSLCVNEISSELRITASAVSQHLKVLKYAGLVTSERKGYWIHYDIDEKSMDCCREMINEFCSCGCNVDSYLCCCNARDLEDIDDLREYEDALERELKMVREKMEDLTKGK